MENDIYQVDREDYKAFLGQLDTTKTHIEESYEDQVHIINIISNKSNTLLCSRVCDAEVEEEHYFIFNYPTNDERTVPKPILKINLESREQVQEFFNALSKFQKENSHD